MSSGKIGWWRSERDKRDMRREKEAEFRKKQQALLMRQMRLMKISELRHMLLPIVAIVGGGILTFLFLF